MKIIEISELEWEQILKKTKCNNFFQLPFFLNLTAKHFKLKNRYFKVIKEKEEYYFSLQEDSSHLAYSPFMGFGGLFSKKLYAFNLNFEVKKVIEDKYNMNIKRIKTFPQQLFLDSSNLPQPFHYTAILPIRKTIIEQEKYIHKNNRTAKRYADKNNVTIRKLQNIDLDDFYDIYKETMKRVNSSYLTPKAFFKDLIIMENTIFLGAFKDSQMVAASVFFYHRDTMYYWSNSSNEVGRKLSANYALIYNALMFCVGKKFSFLDMGSSHSPAIEQSKLRWGASFVPFLTIE